MIVIVAVIVSDSSGTSKTEPDNKEFHFTKLVLILNEICQSIETNFKMRNI